MKLTLNVSTIIFLLFLTINLKAQKKPYYNTEAKVIEAAYNSLDYEMKKGDLIEWAKENKIEGSYAMDITIGGKKGEVITVRAVKRDGEVKSQNMLKNRIKTTRFPFKMPKDKNYKFQYEFKF